MATPRTKADERAELREFFRASNKQYEEHREATLRAIAELRRLEEIKRRRRRWMFR